jgi:peroxiredoxin Q/BCP
MLNQVVPDFCLPMTGGNDFQLSEYKNKKLVVYFYPKDSTPGCTAEGQQFRDLYRQFQLENAEIFGISRDSIKSHENFKAKLGLPYQLLSDSEELACRLFDVIKMKSMYGKQVRGIERSTFLIDGSGMLKHEWRKVKVDGHALDVLHAINLI